MWANAIFNYMKLSFILLYLENVSLKDCTITTPIFANVKGQFIDQSDSLSAQQDVKTH